MTRRNFVLLVDAATAEQQNRITDWLKGKAGYWHNCASGWLIVSLHDDLTAAIIRDEVKRILDTPNTLIVLEVTGSNLDNWAGWGLPDRFEWMRHSWSGTPGKPLLES